MAVEIERKFLVRDDSWRTEVTHQQSIRDGLIAMAPGRKVRVRICDQHATLTVKSSSAGLANVEYEYEIPLADGEELMAHHCLRAEQGPDLAGRCLRGDTGWRDSGRG
jgi:CYTH domain-containing protein